MVDCKFIMESSSEKVCKSVEIWQNYGHEFVASLFWPTLQIGSETVNILVLAPGSPLLSWMKSGQRGCSSVVAVSHLFSSGRQNVTTLTKFNLTQHSTYSLPKQQVVYNCAAVPAFDAFRLLERRWRPDWEERGGTVSRLENVHRKSSGSQYVSKLHCPSQPRVGYSTQHVWFRQPVHRPM